MNEAFIYNSYVNNVIIPYYIYICAPKCGGTPTYSSFHDNILTHPTLKSRNRFINRFIILSYMYNLYRRTKSSHLPGVILFFRDKHLKHAHSLYPSIHPSIHNIKFVCTLLEQLKTLGWIESHLKMIENVRVASCHWE